MASSRPLCFVLMPFGVKPDPAGGPAVDFDRVYDRGIGPGVRAAGLEPVRADEEQVGGIIHKAMFERLLLCDVAVADLTTGNPNVLYELGIRHAARPRTTLTVFAAQRPLPFDVTLLRTVPYRLDADNTLPDAAADELRDAVARHLTELRTRARTGPTTDSPLFQLVEDWRPHVPSPTTSELFTAQVRATEEVNRRVRELTRAAARTDRDPGVARALAEVRRTVLDDATVDLSVLLSLMVAHRALGDWAGMVAVHDDLPADLARQPAVRQLLAFALNRRAETGGDPADADRAQALLAELEGEQGPTAETCGLLGRIHKSRWRRAVDAGRAVAARGLLRQAVDAYERGFAADWRDPYPGVNAATLLDVEGSPASLVRRDRLLPVVRYAAEQRVRGPHAGYFDWATLLELAVLADDRDTTATVLADALAAVAELWQPATTADNLGLVVRARAARGEPTDWIAAVVRELAAASAPPPAPPGVAGAAASAASGAPVPG